LIVAGYSNDVMCYIPTRQILQEGGYEPVASMVYYDKPGPFAPDVEDRIFTTIHQAMRAVGR
jgi:neutral ceramidase